MSLLFQLLNKGVQGEKAYPEVVPWMEALVYSEATGLEVCHTNATDDLKVTLRVLQL